MRILFVSGHSHLPQVIGGVEVNTDLLAAELHRRGHQVAVLAKLSLRDWFGACRLICSSVLRKSLMIDNFLGYTVYRARRPSEVVSELPRFDIAIIQKGDVFQLARAFSKVSIPTVLYLHNREFEEWRQAPQSLAEAMPFTGYLTVSHFIADRFRARYGIEPSILIPFFRRERYATDGKGQFVTFINPVPMKGLDLVLEIAALCPEIPFRFVSAWPLDPFAWARLKLAFWRLPNVTWRGRTADMRSVYGGTRVLLMPSRDEAWGRVATEAQFSGIPVVASDRGGLPEAVGPGGIILGSDSPVEGWVRAIRRLWSDAEFYREHSDAALSHAMRRDLDPDHQISRLLELLSRFIGSV